MFFKQKKETKRKTSFFMAAALVFSLIPAPPVANAENLPNAKLQGNVNNATIEINGTEATSGASILLKNGTATITVKADDGYMFNSVSDVTLQTEITGEASGTTEPSTTPSGSTISPAPSDTPSGSPSSEPGTDATASPTVEPTENPTTEPTETPSVPPATEAPSTPTSAPSSPSSATANGTDGNSAGTAAYSLREAVTGTLDSTKTIITFTLESITQDILIKLSGSAKADTRQFKVTFKNELAKANYEAVCDGKTLQDGSSVTGGSIVSLKISSKERCVFKELLLYVAVRTAFLSVLEVSLIVTSYFSYALPEIATVVSDVIFMPFFTL